VRKYARFYNPIVSFLLRLGLPLGPQALLTVTGRRSGLPRTTPVAINRNGDGWHLISVYGRVDWVRNLEAAGRALITRRLRRFQVTARQLTPDEAAPVLREIFATANPFIRSLLGRYFDADPKDPLQVWGEEAIRHPVFFLTPVSESEYPVPSTEYPVE
jgi:deazaflavin-dependent oxidoreductase (nitroreductase family)